MTKQISPSLMCCDIFNLTEQIKQLEKADVEYLHIDVMDGEFVPNYMLGTDYIKQLRKHTSISLDIHLMVKDTERKLKYIPYEKGDIVSVHYESTNDLILVLTQIREKGAKPYLAINPDTPISVIGGYIDMIDGILIMSVYPGFAGQKMIPSSIDKIKDLREYLTNIGKSLDIEVDGNVSFENAILMSRAGANLFVAGSSSVFKTNDLIDGVKKLRGIL